MKSRKLKTGMRNAKSYGAKSSENAPADLSLGFCPKMILQVLEPKTE
jgi:hypothetical protein